MNAREIFAEALAARPEDHHVHEAFAVFLESLGENAGAIVEWQKVAELMPHDFLPWFELGSLMSKQGAHAVAQAQLRHALAIRPGLICRMIWYG